MGEMRSGVLDARTVGVVLTYAAGTSIGSLFALLVAVGSGPAASIADVTRVVLAAAMIAVVVGGTLRLLGSFHPRGWDVRRVFALAGILGVVGVVAAVLAAALDGFSFGYVLMPFALLPALALVYGSRCRNSTTFTVGLAGALVFVGPLVFAAVIALATMVMSATGDRQLAAALNLFGGEDFVNASFAVMGAVWNFIVVLALAAPTWLWLQRTRTTEPAR